MWNDPRPLLSVLDSQFGLLLEAESQRQLLLLPKLLSTLLREPVFSSLLVDLQREGEAVLDAHAECCTTVRGVLRELWRRHRVDLTPHLAADKVGRDIDGYWELDRYDEGLQATDVLAFPEDGPIRDEVPGDKAGRLIRAFRHWVAVGRMAGLDADWIRDVSDQLESQLRDHERSVRHLRLATESLGWCAFMRLRALVVRLNPEADDIVRLYAYNQFRDVAYGAQPLAQTRESDGGRRVAWALDVIARDARLLREELRVRLLRGLSRRSVLSRYAARCEAFRAAELRKLGRKGRREGPLTLDLAAYLFDCGFTPIMDPTIGQLRPDVIDVSSESLFYVEAKQYAGAPRQKLEAAYRQVWSTWMRLEKQYSLPEGFLVVFRRGGPLVDLPHHLDFGGRRLHSLLVDISPSAGSSEQAVPITLDPERLLPSTEAGSRPSVRTRTRS